VSEDREHLTTRDQSGEFSQIGPQNLIGIAQFVKVDETSGC